MIKLVSKWSSPCKKADEGVHIGNFSRCLHVLLFLAVGARYLSQAEKEIMPCKAEQIHIRTIIFPHNDNLHCKCLQVFTGTLRGNWSAGIHAIPVIFEVNQKKVWTFYIYTLY